MNRLAVSVSPGPGMRCVNVVMSQFREPMMVTVRGDIIGRVSSRFIRYRVLYSQYE